ncbi:hypothetical protein PV516_19475 [Streptomyces scabiei]|uniref:deazapurine DNA modification protein DpdA family protein n=1 Tax=Streptomyces scabiei TaxID=1930 RepID=UPI0029BD80C1|nr:hypothetical protein [Streptomyces scabiei]MDX3165971.1 hypothetical protein [Streptomyces scabiei]
MKFYLGTHMVNWLGEVGVPLFISRNRLVKRRTFPKAIAPWALDSGGFTELRDHGRWRITPEEYAAEVRRYRDEIGMLDWAAPMDWMCEPWVINGGVRGGQQFHGTFLSVREHQQRTVENLVRLREIAPDLPFIPVLQGWELQDYLDCVRLYSEAGIDLTREPVVGLGSVCRRQATAEIAELVSSLSALGLRLHGFGVKTAGVADYGDQLMSSDSMAWSFGARYEQRLAQCTHRAKNCANCSAYALAWRQRVLEAPARAATPSAAVPVPFEQLALN